MTSENTFTLEEITSLVSLPIPSLYKNFIATGQHEKYNNATNALLFGKKKLVFTNLQDIVKLCAGAPWGADDHLRDGDNGEHIYFPIVKLAICNERDGEGAQVSFIALDCRAAELPVVKLNADHEGLEIERLTETFDAFLHQLTPPGEIDPLVDFLKRKKRVASKIRKGAFQDALPMIETLVSDIEMLAVPPSAHLTTLQDELLYYRAIVRYECESAGALEDLSLVVAKAIRDAEPFKDWVAKLSQTTIDMIHARVPLAKLLLINNEPEKAVAMLKQADYFTYEKEYKEILEKSLHALANKSD